MRLVKMPDAKTFEEDVWINADAVACVSGGTFGEAAAKELVGKPWTRVSLLGDPVDCFYQFNVPIKDILILFGV